MEKFTELILNLAGTRSNAPVTEKSRTHIKNRLKTLYARYETPDHPPYSAMIERALNALNEKGGSTVSSISQFMESEYDGLPLAHSSLLKHYIDKLCISGDIAVVCGNRYKLRNDSPTSSSLKENNNPPMSRKRSQVEDTKPKKKKKRQKQVVGKGEDPSSDEEDELSEKNPWSGIQEHGNTENIVIQREDDTNSTLPSCDALDDQSPEYPPGFESVVAKNSAHSPTNDHCHPQEDAEVVGEEKLHESKRGLRLVIRWNAKHPHSRELIVKENEHKVGDEKRVGDRENRHEELTERQKKTDIITYQRRRKTKLPKNEAVNGNFLSKLEKLDDMPLLKDQEELDDFEQPHSEVTDQKKPCELQQKNQPRRSLRNRKRTRRD